MNDRTKMINEFYKQIDEDARLNKSRQGQLEYFITMNYTHRFLNDGNRVLEIGSGTGRYSIALAREGYRVSAIELVENNLEVLLKNSEGLNNIDNFHG